MSVDSRDESLIGELSNYKYWSSLKPAKTQIKNSRPTLEAINFERQLQKLESENRQFEMGMMMKRASSEKVADPHGNSLQSLQHYVNTCKKQPRDSMWYLTKDLEVKDDEDFMEESSISFSGSALVIKNPEKPAIESSSHNKKPLSSK